MLSLSLVPISLNAIKPNPSAVIIAKLISFFCMMWCKAEKKEKKTELFD